MIKVAIWSYEGGVGNSTGEGGQGLRDIVLDIHSADSQTLGY
jgi:hypothetical protein